MKGMPQFKKNMFVSVVFLLGIFLFFNAPAYSQTVTDLEKEIEESTKKIAEKENILGNIEKRIAEIKGGNQTLSQKIQLMTDEINKVKDTIAQKDSEIETKGKEIEAKQEQLSNLKDTLDLVSAELYMETRNRVSTFFLSDWSDLVRNFYLKRNIVSDLRLQVEMIGGEFSSLAEAKELLDSEKALLDAQKKELDDSLAMLATEKAKLEAELSKQYSQKSSLSAEITDLNKKVSQLQAALIAARGAGTISSGGSTSTVPGTSISQAPAGYFGVFSIGAYTHRNGMSQWGAKARADAGQTTAQILSFYYPGGRISQGSVNVGFGVEPLTTSISVDGEQPSSFEDYYLLGIQEMPEYFGLEALKAQAIAARTFAVRYTQNGRKSICKTQQCQVFGLPLKSGAWKTAVEQTRGQILVDSGNTPILTQYAAVHGAWVNNVGWDTQSGNGDNWYNDAWEKISGVNWFYRSWYINGSGYSGETCGHSPYLSPSEMAIILNAYLVKNDMGLRSTPDKSRLLPSDYGRCPGGARDNDFGRTDKVPYSLDELQGLLSNPVTSISSVYASFENGQTKNVYFQTNRGLLSIPGLAFKDIYNQMAPGHMRIQQQSSYAFFNIEKK
jgi:peptidoglycan hydrolase CwlO-like protein